MWGKGSTAYSERVIRAYMCRYATEERIGRPVTDEDIARIHNGGPNGWRRASTDEYWERVQNALRDITQNEEKGQVMIIIIIDCMQRVTQLLSC